MKIHHQENNQHGEFFILNEQGNKVAELSYFYETPQTINANHTFVDDSLRGKGMADKLYHALIQFIQANQLNLHPTCSYIVKKWHRSK